MAYTYSTQTVVSDGTLQLLALAFEYIDQVDVTVFVDYGTGGPVEEFPPGSIWEWVGREAIRFNTPLPAGVVVTLRRLTEVEHPLNTFTSGAMFNAPTVDENFTQMLYLVQEAREGAGLTGMYNDFDMHGYRLRNLGRGIAPGDAVRLGQMDEAVYDTPAHQAVVEGLATEVANRKAAVAAEETARSAADTALQSQISGGRPLTASAFSPISWHDQTIPNSVVIPPGKNAWSFGPTVEIATGQRVDVGVGSHWTIANGARTP